MSCTYFLSPPVLNLNMIVSFQTFFGRDHSLDVFYKSRYPSKQAELIRESIKAA